MKTIVSGLLAIAVLAGIAVQANAADPDLRDRNGAPICTHGDR